MTAPSKRDQIRAIAERLLRQTGTPTRIEDLFPLVAEELARTMPNEKVDRKTVNNSLHDDRQQRFVRVARGRWTVK